MIITRRHALIGSTALLSGCDRLNESTGFRSLTGSAERGNFLIQRSLQDRMGLAREFRSDQRSPVFRANGTRLPEGEDYARHATERFANWRVRVDGLVRAPLSLSMEQLRTMPARVQTTRHDCVEGWSAIGEWRGTPLKLVLDAAGLLPSARFLVFHCADTMRNGTRYYESIDLIDALHPQTMLAWALNGDLLGVPHGAPVRLRVERQLGYKHAKYVERIEAVSDLAGIGSGQGGYWEDVGGYEWYAGI